LKHVALLLKAGADPAAVDLFGKSGAEAMQESGVGSGAVVAAADGGGEEVSHTLQQAFRAAMERMAYNEARVLLHAGGDVNAPDDQGNTALHSCAEIDDFRGAQLLVEEFQAKFWRKNNDGYTALDRNNARLNPNMGICQLGSDVTAVIEAYLQRLVERYDRLCDESKQIKPSMEEIDAMCDLDPPPPEDEILRLYQAHDSLQDELNKARVLCDKAEQALGRQR